MLFKYAKRSALNLLLSYFWIATDKYINTHDLMI